MRARQIILGARGTMMGKEGDEIRGRGGKESTGVKEQQIFKSIRNGNVRNCDYRYRMCYS